MALAMSQGLLFSCYPLLVFDKGLGKCCGTILSGLEDLARSCTGAAIDLADGLHSPFSSPMTGQRIVGVEFDDLKQTARPWRSSLQPLSGSLGLPRLFAHLAHWGL